MRPFIFLPAVLAWWSGSLAAASGIAAFQAPESIDRAVTAFVEAEGLREPQPRPVDRRLRLKPCSLALLADWHGSSRDTVTVQCPDAGGWRIFVSIRTHSARAASASAPAVERGDTVTVRITGRGFAVTASGNALSAARTGEWVQVRTHGGKAQLRGQVQGAGIVAVALP